MTPNVRTTPFVDDTRELANQCLNRHYLMTGRDLQSDTPHADREALNLIRAGFAFAIREAQLCGREMLALHLEELLKEPTRETAFTWLNGLANDGKGDYAPRSSGLQPIGGAVARILDRVKANQ